MALDMAAVAIVSVCVCVSAYDCANVYVCMYVCEL